VAGRRGGVFRVAHGLASRGQIGLRVINTNGVRKRGGWVSGKIVKIGRQAARKNTTMRVIIGRGVEQAATVPAEEFAVEEVDGGLGFEFGNAYGRTRVLPN
jgi:hypothetical protein